MRLRLSRSEVRSWRIDDLASLVSYANNRKIWLNLRDRFPHPYTTSAGRDFLRGIVIQRPETAFAIDVGGEAVGGIGFAMLPDVERVSAEIGYWLGEPFWGWGIASEAVAAVTQYAIETHGFTRMFAVPFASNAASCRVLEKAGYALEGRLRRSAIKNGEVIDQLQYGFTAAAQGPAAPPAPDR
jgi:[ribosomal protein S5]-alanine N-acetyltransferase